TDELAKADGRIPYVEVREDGVDPQRGIAEGAQYILYREEARDRCLVRLAEAIGEWHQRREVTLQLLPTKFVRDILPLLGNPALRCTYNWYIDGGEMSVGNRTTILPITGGLFVRVAGVPRQALVQVHVECRGRVWVSSFEKVDAPGIRLREQE